MMVQSHRTIGFIASHCRTPPSSLLSPPKRRCDGPVMARMRMRMWIGIIRNEDEDDALVQCHDFDDGDVNSNGDGI